MVTWLASLMILAAFLNGALSLWERYLSSTIGEGLIYDLRTALYDHVQRMPIAFFTRTQTGSLMSRLGSDVLDAQRAVGTLASVVSIDGTRSIAEVAEACMQAVAQHFG